jgi:hypothetical protein
MAGPRGSFRWDKSAEAKVRAAAGRGLRKAAALARSRIVRAISKSARVGTGGIRTPVKGSGPPMQFQRSKPGEPPRADTGKLRQSIFWSDDKARMVATVGTTLKYGVTLELGQKSRKPVVARRKKTLAFGYKGRWVFPSVSHPKPIKKRPYVVASVEKNMADLRQAIRKEVLKATGGRF